MSRSSSEIDIDYIRHQIANITTVESAINETIVSDAPTAQALSNDVLNKLNQLLKYIDERSGGTKL